MSNRVALVTAFLSFLAGGIPAVRAQEAAPVAPGAEDSVAKQNEADTEKLLRSIAGKETMPAEKVFKNVKVMKGMPAGKFVQVMNVGYSRSLGVGCDHCHVREDWAADEKRPKLAAREMIEFAREVNAKLRTLQHLDTNEPLVNCTTCHRGSLEPATSLDGKH